MGKSKYYTWNASGDHTKVLSLLIAEDVQNY